MGSRMRNGVLELESGMGAAFSMSITDPKNHSLPVDLTGAEVIVRMPGDSGVVEFSSDDPEVSVPTPTNGFVQVVLKPEDIDQLQKRERMSWEVVVDYGENDERNRRRRFINGLTVWPSVFPD